MSGFVNIHAAKTHLSRLVDRAASGEEIVIARAGKPVARIAPLASAAPKPKLREPGPQAPDADDFWARAAAIRRRLHGRHFKESAAVIREGRHRQARKF
jgi:prevent-host-death family protein